MPLCNDRSGPCSCVVSSRPSLIFAMSEPQGAVPQLAPGALFWFKSISIASFCDLLTTLEHRFCPIAPRPVGEAIDLQAAALQLAFNKGFCCGLSHAPKPPTNVAPPPLTLTPISNLCTVPMRLLSHCAGNNPGLAGEAHVRPSFTQLSESQHMDVSKKLANNLAMVFQDRFAPVRVLILTAIACCRLRTGSAFLKLLCAPCLTLAPGNR